MTSTITLCTCGEPVATCPHLGAFASIEAKHTYFKQLAAVDADVETLGRHTDVALAIAAAEKAAEEASKLPLGPEVAAAIAGVLGALAKARALAALIP